MEKSQFFDGGARLALTVWIGTMVSVGYLVAPVLFMSLEKQLAGQIAGQLFHITAIIGVVCGSLLLAYLGITLRATLVRNWRFWALLVMLSLVLVGMLILQPMMQDLKAQGLAAGSAQAGAFGRLHGISSVLYLINSVLGLALAAAPVRRPAP